MIPLIDEQCQLAATQRREMERPMGDPAAEGFSAAQRDAANARAVERLLKRRGGNLAPVAMLEGRAKT